MEIKAGTFTINEHPFSIQKLIDDIQYIFEFQCTQKKLFFKVQIDNSLAESTFNSDMSRIKQILINLISNSFKFTERGGITLEIAKTHKFEEFSFTRVGYLQFKVIDSGIGIAQSDMPHLFQLFSMVEKHKTSINFNGTGLGLSISKMLVEKLGGEVSLTSTENIGTKIGFSIQESAASSQSISLSPSAGPINLFRANL